MSAPSSSITSCGDDDIALRLAHLVPGAIDKEAVREQRAIRREAVHHAGDEKRRVKPAAMLVGAFEIQVRRERAFVLVRSAQHGEMRRTGVEPHVERVFHLLVVRRVVPEQLAAGRASATLRARPAPPAARLLPGDRACADAARRFPCGRRTASARPIAAAATSSSPGGWRSCRASRALPQAG